MAEKTNPDLQRERQSATIVPEDITSQLYGKDGMHVRRLARELVINEPSYKCEG